MSARIRGQEAIVRVTVDGVPVAGDFAKVKDLTITPRTDLTEEGYLGETFDDLDVMHHGADFSFTVDQENGESLEYLAQLVNQEEANQAPSNIIMTAILNYREAGVPSKEIVLQQAVLKVNDLSFSGRKEYISTSFEGKAKRIKIFEQ